RTVLLFIALVNQTLIMFGKAALPVTEDQVNTLADTLYMAGSTVFTIVTSVVAWYKNNYEGKLQKEVLKQKGLTK
ncbi:phage holin, partial [Bacillus sp. JJ353]|uniref:phage holin n=1 Tax=Bacillus sp. JJ353 TaxID=3122967 RepID=UPI0033912815